MKKKKGLVWGLVGGALVVVSVVFVVLSSINYTVADDLVFEVNSGAKVVDLFSDIKLGSVDDAEAEIDVSEVGQKTREVKFKNLFGLQSMVDVSYEVVDTKAPEIVGDDALTIFKNDTKGIASYYDISDNSAQDVEIKVDGECDTTVVGSCEVKIVASDKVGNEATKDISVNVVVDPEVAALSKNEYYIMVNRKQNVVMVYALGRDGEYNSLVKTFVASTGQAGSETIVGTFAISSKYEALYLVGNVWGHYATRISGRYYFHSVPYFAKGNPHWDDLEYIEYNKLGEGASAGCVRLAVRDAKWIYDNVSAGTTVEIYDADELPNGVEKPVAVKIDVEDTLRRGWDPTDADAANPWK